MLKTVFVLIDRGDYYRDAGVDYEVASDARVVPDCAVVHRSYAVPASR